MNTSFNLIEWLGSQDQVYQKSPCTIPISMSKFLKLYDHQEMNYTYKDPELQFGKRTVWVRAKMISMYSCNYVGFCRQRIFGINYNNIIEFIGNNGIVWE